MERAGDGWGPGNASRLRDSLHAFLGAAPWVMLCNRLLHTLPDTALRDFADELLPEAPEAAAKLPEAAAKLVFGRVRWHALDDVILAAALGLRGSQLWRLISEDADAAQVCI